MVLQTWAQARIDPSRAAVVMAMEPVWAAGFAVALGGREDHGPNDHRRRWRSSAAIYLVEIAPRHLASRRSASPLEEYDPMSNTTVIIIVAAIVVVLAVIAFLIIRRQRYKAALEEAGAGPSTPVPRWSRCWITRLPRSASASSARSTRASPAGRVAGIPFRVFEYTCSGGRPEVRPAAGEPATAAGAAGSVRVGQRRAVRRTAAAVDIDPRLQVRAADPGYARAALTSAQRSTRSPPSVRPATRST